MSHKVTTVAPASTAALTASFRKSASLLPASHATNSTSLQHSLASAVSFATFLTMAAGFILVIYSIWTVLTGATTWIRGFFASLRAFHVFFSVSFSVSDSGTATVLSFTALAIDLIRRLSVLLFLMAAVSMTWIPTLSSSLESSIFSLKERS